MPLLRRQVFQQASGTERFKDGDEVYYCEATGELFSNYEDYFHRVMLISSMVWSCAFTGRPNLTYAEALESEKAARKLLKTFPAAVKGPFLLVATHTKRTAINEMHEDVYSFIKDQLYKGEEVDAYDPTTKLFRRARIMQVVADGSPSKPRASRLTYHVLGMDNIAPMVWTVAAQSLKRDRSSMTRDKCKLFLKQHVEAGPGGLLRIKEESLRKFVLEEGWTDEQVFFGQVPDFELSKKLKLREERTKAKADGQVKRKQSVAQKGNAVDISTKPTEKKKKQKKDTATKGKKEGIAEEAEGGGGEEREQKKSQKKAAGANKQQQSNSKHSDKSQDDAFESNTKSSTEEMLRLKVEQEAAAKKQLEEEKAVLMQQVALALKKYNALFDDQELTDQRVMPPVRPLCSLIPAKHFSNFVFILEFLNSFTELLSIRSKFANGLTMDLLERALLLREVNGPLSDILQVLLGAIFSQQVEEENEVDVRYRRPENIAQKRLCVPEQTRARDAAVWIEKHYCAKLHELPMDSTTVSELLRLHFLSSGALVEEKAVKHRYYNRGGFGSADDPGLRLVLEYPHIFRALKLYSVYQLPVGDVIELLCCLIHQLLTYSGVRELVEERLERARTARTSYQANRVAQRRIAIKTGSLKYVAREDMKKERAALEDPEGPEKEAKKRQLQERMEEQCAQIEADAQRQLKQLQTEAEKLKEDFFDYQIYLGTDRCFRNYWLFESLPGLFVEHDWTFAGRCLERPTYNIPGLAKCATDQRRKYITKSIMTAGSAGTWMSGTAESVEEALPEGTNLEVFEKLFIRGSAELERIAELQSLVIAAAKAVTIEPEQQLAGQEGPKVNGNGALPEPSPVIVPSRPSRPPTNEELLMCTANPDSCPVHTPFFPGTVSWGYYATADELDALIHSLSTRGVREKQLRETLECERDLIVMHIEKCPIEKLSVGAGADRDALLGDIVARYQRKYDAPNFSYEPGTEPNEILEVVFREHLLELEAKITVGYLGVMRVRNRAMWREAIESRSYDPQTDEPLQWGPKRLAKLEGHQNGGRESEQDAQQENREQQQQQEQSQGAGAKDKDDDQHGSDDESEWNDMERLLSNAKDPGYCLPDTSVAPLDETVDYVPCPTYPLHESDSLLARVHDLARALLQIEQCIDQKFLRHPFGPKKDHKDKNVMLQKQYQGQRNLVKWEVSLMRSTCFSQLFLHHAVLYDAIHWSRSAERISCMICRRKGDPDLTLLCDECNRACHTYCLKPKLKEVPAGDWFCMRCRPDEHKAKKPSGPSATGSTAAKKKKIFKWEEEDEQDDDESENENMEEEEEAQEEEQEEEHDGERSSEMAEEEEEEEKDYEVDDSAREEDPGSDEEYGVGVGRKATKCNKAGGGGKSGKEVAVRTVTSNRSSRAAAAAAAAAAADGLHRVDNDEDVSEDEEEDEEEQEEEEVEDDDEEEEYASYGVGGAVGNRRGGWGGLLRTSTGKRKIMRSDSRPPTEYVPVSKRPRRTTPKRSLVNSHAASSEKQLRHGRESDGAVSGKRVSARTSKGRRRSTLTNGVANGSIEASDSHDLLAGGAHSAPRRSRRTGDELPLNSVALYTLVDDVLKHPDSWPFNRPVSAKEVPDYYKVIKTPMDFARIKSKLNMGDYKINEQMLADVQLVFRNCDLYNTDETDVYRIGRQLERYVVKRCKELGLPFTPSDMQKVPLQQNGPTGGGSASRKVNGVANHSK